MSENKVKIHEHGYLLEVERWGSDEGVIAAARMSTGKSFQGWGPHHSDDCPSFGGRKTTDECGCPGKPGDEKLLRRLWEDRHTSPFEMAGMTVEVQAPVFTFRQWARHRTQSVNEASARYAPLPDVNYVPTVGRLLAASDGGNRQAAALAGSEALTPESALAWLAELADVYEHCERAYQSGLRRGVPKELARLCVPAGRYSRMRASANLLNWLRFLGLRMAPDAQQEIQAYARALHGMLSAAFPRTLALFDEGGRPS